MKQYSSAVALLALTASTVGYAQNAECNRQCLAGFLNKYLEALVAHDPAALPVTGNVKYIENGVRINLGDGLWQTVSATRTQRLDVIDEAAGLVGMLGHIDENGSNDWYAVRLKVEKGELISEILTLVNRELHTLDQAPVFQRWISDEEARSNYEAAWDIEQSLLSLLRRHPDDLRIASFHRHIADKRLHILKRYVSGEYPAQVVLGCYYGDPPNCHAGSRGAAIRGLFSDAERNYASAVRVMLRHELYASEELKEIEMELVRASYELNREGIGRESLRRLIAYEVAKSAPLIDRVEALVRMADWDLLFAEGTRRRDSVLETYEDAYRQLEQGDIAQTSIDNIFSPQMPVVLPPFSANPLVPDSMQETIGHLDVAFEITKYGDARDIEILGSSNATEDDERDVEKLIRSIRFRPRLADGRFEESSPVVVRYYFAP